MTSFGSLSKSKSVHEGGFVASPLGEGERMKVRGWIFRAAALVALNATLTLSALHPVAIPGGGDPSLHHVISAPKITVVIGKTSE